MATLQSILAVRSPAPTEDNLEKGKMWAFSMVADYTTFSGCHCWIAPSAGTVELEVIGAGGSGSRMCCCSATWQWIQVVGYVCMQERAVETVVYVTEVVQKREWYVGNPLAHTDVYVLKADDQELVFVHQVQHEDVV
jgi:hypothetical protein